MTDRRAERDKDTKAELDQKLRWLTEQSEDCPEVAITYFQADQKTAGGADQTANGSVKKVDDVQQVVVMTNGARIVEQTAEFSKYCTARMDKELVP